MPEPSSRVPSHRWDLSPREARELQQELRHQVICSDQFGSIQFVAGTDVAFEDNKATTRAAVAVLSFPELELHEYAIARRPTSFPYVPGLLSFRETPVVLDALARLETRPDLVLCDAQGFAHPRRFGLACHLGVLTDLPVIGVAKTRLVGTHGSVPVEKGAWVPLLDDGEVIGAVLRTRERVKPVYVSIGHRISLDSAIDYVLRCVTRYRLPETTRWADRLAAGIMPP